MPDARDFGEQTPTEAQITAWVALVRAAKTAARTFSNPAGKSDSMRPAYGSSRPSHDGEAE